MTPLEKRRIESFNIVVAERRFLMGSDIRQVINNLRR